MLQSDGNIFSANVRDLNSNARRDDVRNLINSSSCTVACLQESRLNFIDSAIVSQTLAPAYTNSFCFLPAIQTRGGILLAYNDKFGR
jgi:hypothetical protein